jgi:hypothetical protein
MTASEIEADYLSYLKRKSISYLSKHTPTSAPYDYIHSREGLKAYINDNEQSFDMCSNIAIIFYRIKKIRMNINEKYSKWHVI